MASLLGPRSWKGTHTFSLSLCVRGTRGYTVSTQDVLTSTAPLLPALSDYSLHPRHTTLSVPPLSLGLLSTPQSLRTFHLTLAPLAQCTHCHFVMQARALRVPELCDDHIPPSRLVTNSHAEPRYRSVNTLVLPDTWLTQGGPVTFLACALHQLFVRSCDLAHHGLYCSLVCVCTHHSSLQHLLFRCLPLLSSRAHMDEPQCMRLPLGTTEWNHSYYKGNSLSALHSLQQLQAAASSPSPVQMSASTRESHGAAPSSSWLHLLRLMFPALRVLDQSTRYFLIRLCRRLYTASQLMMPLHNYRSRSSLSGASFSTIL